MLKKNPCQKCDKNVEGKTCRPECEEWAKYEAEKQSIYKTKQEVSKRELDYQEYLNYAMRSMRQGKRK